MAPAVETTRRTSTDTITVDRKGLCTALDRVKPITAGRTHKPILNCVRITGADDMLQLAATDGEVKLFTQIEVNGCLPTCVVSCADLLRRVKASKGETCTLSARSRPPRLVINGGRVEHTLPGMDESDFPPIPDRHCGDTLAVGAEELRKALATASHAVASEPSRYAINGLLLESDDDGVRLVATDGRRMAIAELQRYEAKFQGRAIIPARVAKLVEKYAAREDIPLVVAIKPNATDDGEELPAEIYIAGPNWLLSTPEIDGSFPLYRDVVPLSHSRFAVNRRQLAETLKEVALAVSYDSNRVCVDLTPRRIRLTVKSPDAGESSAKLHARFIGGGDSEIHTAFNPGYLLDAVKALDGEEIVIDVDQNGLGCDGRVFSKPALLYAQGNEATRCLVMPINADMPVTPENLGSNYPTEEEVAA